MSRELKFRAWVEEAKWDYYVYNIQERADMAEWFGEPTVHIEQYTGLKDKNGTEIYEGDIVEEEIDFNSKMTDGVFKYKVYWDSDTLTWGLEPIGFGSIHNDLWECNQSIEVIGNIHENKELLKGE